MLLVTDLERGGTPLRIAALARELHAMNVRVHVGCLAPAGPLTRELEEAGAPTFDCGAGSVRDVFVLWRLVKHVRRIRPDVIHATLVHANVAARLAGVVCGVPVLTSTATIEVERRWHRIVELLTGRLDRGHIVNSAAVARHVQRTFGLPGGRVHLVPPMVHRAMEDADRGASRAALGITEQEFVVSWVGRLDPVKRLDVLVRTAERMTDKPARFLVVGDGPARGELERSLRISNAGRIVHMLGWREDIPAILAASDAFLFPSLTEGMPNAVLEAMSAGLPVVASDIPATRELAGDAGRLLLVAGEDERGYAEALTRLCEDDSLRDQLAERARTWATKNLRPRVAAEALLRVYRQGGLRIED